MEEDKINELTTNMKKRKKIDEESWKREAIRYAKVVADKYKKDKEEIQNVSKKL